jgi:hypothetical protein
MTSIKIKQSNSNKNIIQPLKPSRQVHIKKSNITASKEDLEIRRTREKLSLAGFSGDYEYGE